MTKNVFLSLVLLASVVAQADIVETFNRMEKASKGPFSLNYLQGNSARVPVTEGSPGGLQFQAAYRAGPAVELATQYDMYVGNLFTTNYYELMGEFVYGDPYGSHPLDHQALVGQSAKALPKAASMVRNWVLEKYYASKFPAAPLSKSFALRGISGSEYEQVYAQYLFDFYLTALSTELQVLPAALLIKESPIGSSSSLDKAREMIASSYDYFVGRFGAGDSRVKRMYKIRNAIHNQLSPNIVVQIDQYLKDFPFYEAEGNTYLQAIREILKTYYAISPTKISALAVKAGAGQVKAAADECARSGNSTKNLLQLSLAASDLKTVLSDESKVPYEKKTATLLLLSSTSQYLGKEILSLKSIDSPAQIQIALNAVYIEGFLIKNNWQYFVTQLAAAKDVAAATAILPELAEIGSDTLSKAMSPTLNLWIKVKPEMQNFIADTVKSSSLNVVSVIEQKVRK